MMPIRDPDMISITSAPETPAPRISNERGNKVETVRIVDRLTFRIEIPDKTLYGIFARVNFQPPKMHFLSANC
jgi:hypothetical protein